MTINKIEVSLFPYESALSKYPIKRPTIIFEKRLILAWRVTYVHVYKVGWKTSIGGIHWLECFCFRTVHFLQERKF